MHSDKGQILGNVRELEQYFVLLEQGFKTRMRQHFVASALVAQVNREKSRAKIVWFCSKGGMNSCLIVAREQLVSEGIRTIWSRSHPRELNHPSSRSELGPFGFKLHDSGF